MRYGIFLLIVITSSCRMNYPVEQVEFKVKDASVSEGKRMTMASCGPCHYNTQHKNLSGQRLEDTPGIVGKVFASNITQHREAGIGGYSDAQLAYLLRTGISKDGRLMPYMKRPNMANEDIENIIAFLRSDDPLVAPSAHVAGETKYSPAGKFGISRSKPIAYDATVIEKPKEEVALGKYLIDNLGCFHCHSKTFMKIDEEHPEESKGYMGGGNELKGSEGKTIKSPNLTFHETGIASWTSDDFKRALQQGMSKDKGVITFPMPQYPELTDTEILAMYAYLKTVPHIDNEVK